MKGTIVDETDYILVTNRAAISQAIKILRDVNPEKKYGIDQVELMKSVNDLRKHEDRLFSMIIRGNQ